MPTSTVADRFDFDGVFFVQINWGLGERGRSHVMSAKVFLLEVAQKELLYSKRDGNRL